MNQIKMQRPALAVLLILMMMSLGCKKGKVDSVYQGDWVAVNPQGAVNISIENRGKMVYTNQTCGRGKECAIKATGYAIQDGDVIHLKNYFNKYLWDFYIESKPEKFDTTIVGSGTNFHWRMKIKEVVNCKSDVSGDYYGKLKETTFYKN